MRSLPVTRYERDFGWMLWSCRRRHQLSQTELADASGLDHSYLCRLETGQRKPSRAVLQTICTAMQASPAERTALLLAADFRPDGKIGDRLLKDAFAAFDADHAGEGARWAAD